jgi:hypothetical protein
MRFCRLIHERLGLFRDEVWRYLHIKVQPESKIFRHLWENRGKLFDTTLYLINSLADGRGEAIYFIGIRPAGL